MNEKALETMRAQQRQLTAVIDRLTRRVTHIEAHVGLTPAPGPVPAPRAPRAPSEQAPPRKPTVRQAPGVARILSAAQLTAARAAQAAVDAIERPERAPRPRGIGLAASTAPPAPPATPPAPAAAVADPELGQGLSAGLQALETLGGLFRSLVQAVPAPAPAAAPVEHQPLDAVDQAWMSDELGDQVPPVAEVAEVNAHPGV